MSSTTIRSSITFADTIVMFLLSVQLINSPINYICQNYKIILIGLLACIILPTVLKSNKKEKDVNTQAYFTSRGESKKGLNASLLIYT